MTDRIISSSHRGRAAGARRTPGPESSEAPPAPGRHGRRDRFRAGVTGPVAGAPPGRGAVR
eukprot:753858-Hanusia_phi.AAC.5